MKKNKIQEKDRLLLPANFIFWEKIDKNEVKLLGNKKKFSVQKYNTTKCEASLFYKPIARLFQISKLYEE